MVSTALWTSRRAQYPTHLLLVLTEAGARGLLRAPRTKGLCSGEPRRAEVGGMGVSGQSRTRVGGRLWDGHRAAQASQMEDGPNPAPSPVLGEFQHQTKTYDERRLVIFSQ